MENIMIKAAFFDLFFTLIRPDYSCNVNEYDILGLSADAWERYAENPILYQERAIGRIKSEEDIIGRILSSIPLECSDAQKQQVQKAREDRMRNALLNVQDEVLETLKHLKQKHIKVGLISNADVIDCKYWKESALAPLFDDVIFSCNVGMLKPDIRIYRLAMERMGVISDDSIFVGDGGSNELSGAKEAGMRTVFTEFLECKTKERKEEIVLYADCYVEEFKQIMECI